jgi:hypothetical protein
LAPAVALAMFALPASSSHAAMHDMAAMDGMSHATAIDAASGGSKRAAAGQDTAGFHVGTADHPLVAEGPSGPLWSQTHRNRPGSTMHGTFAEQYVAGALAARRSSTDAASDPVATRAVLTTGQATKQLSKSCQRLLKKRRSKLGKADRRKYAKCVRQRGAVISASEPSPTTTTGVSAPAAPVAGPAPVNTPGPQPTPDPTVPAATTPPPTTPVKGKVYAAVGVTAIDGAEKFKLTRATATADIVNFELDNTDKQAHNLAIFATDGSGAIVGAPTIVFATVAAGDRKYKDVALAPGTYSLWCQVPGHEAMAVPFTVYAPPAA